jgi:SAM domain (Sterile alpha motif)
MDVGSWLRGLGLERYEASFRENEADGSVLPSLTAEDHLLAPVYGWFTEGFDTVDLRSAKSVPGTLG